MPVSDEHPGVDGAAVRLRVHDPPSLSASFAKVSAHFEVSGEIAIFVADDLAIYSPGLEQTFTVTVRFTSSASSSPTRDATVPWAFERTLTAAASQPSFSRVGSLSFSQRGLEMSRGDTVAMSLVDARWSLSPLRPCQP